MAGEVEAELIWRGGVAIDCCEAGEKRSLPLVAAQNGDYGALAN